MDEIIFAVEEAPEGGYSARALGVPIFTEADDLVLLTERTLAAAPATRSRVRVGGTILPDGDHSVPARSRRVDRWTPLPRRCGRMTVGGRLAAHPPMSSSSPR